MTSPAAGCGTPPFFVDVEARIASVHVAHRARVSAIRDVVLGPHGLEVSHHEVRALEGVLGVGLDAVARRAVCATGDPRRVLGAVREDLGPPKRVPRVRSALSNTGADDRPFVLTAPDRVATGGVQLRARLVGVFHGATDHPQNDEAHSDDFHDRRVEQRMCRQRIAAKAPLGRRRW